MCGDSGLQRGTELRQSPFTDGRGGQQRYSGEAVGIQQSPQVRDALVGVHPTEGVDLVEDDQCDVPMGRRGLEVLVVEHTVGVFLGIQNPDHQVHQA